VIHDQIEALTLSDRTIITNEGDAMQEGSSHDSYHNPANLFEGTPRRWGNRLWRGSGIRHPIVQRRHPDGAADAQLAAELCPARERCNGRPLKVTESDAGVIRMLHGLCLTQQNAGRLGKRLALGVDFRIYTLFSACCRCWLGW